MKDAEFSQYPGTTTSSTRFIFNKIGLVYRSGMPLHGYRLSEDAYVKLHHHLKDAAQYRRLADCAAPFAMWAAERFRREYDGGQYTWAFLTKPIKAQLEAQDLYFITRRGLSWFGRQLATADHGTTYYLKTLAAEGGLPEALLSDPDGTARRLVRGLLSDIDKMGRGAPQEALDQLTAQRARTLTLGFRTEEFREILRDFCLALLERRAEIPPAIPADARQAWLDTNRPGWKDSLPLRVDSAAAQSLLQDAVRSETSSGRDTIASRLLVRVGNQWVSKVAVERHAEVPSWMMQIEDAAFRSLRLLPGAELAQHAPGLILSAYREPGSQVWEVRREGSALNALFPLPLDRPIAFRMVAEGKSAGLHMPAGGHAIALEDIPTVWAMDQTDANGNASALRKLGASSLRTRSQYLWVLVGNENAKFEELDTEQDGTIGAFTLWKVSGRGRVYGDGWSLSISTNAEEEGAESLLVSGTTVPRLRDKNRSEFYSGVPSFHAHYVDGTGRRLTARSLCWRPSGHRAWKSGVPNADTCLGQYQFGWKDDAGALRAFATALLLPAKATVSVAACRDGRFEFRAHGLPKGTLVSLGHGTSGLVPPNGTLTLELHESRMQSGTVHFRIRPPDGSTREFEASLPRPGHHGYFVDSNDHLLLEDIVLDLGSLQGWRILTPNDQRAELRLKLQSDDAPKQPIVFEVANETLLTQLLPRLRGLMAIGGPDSELRMRVIVGASQSRRIKLRRFLRDGAWNGTALTLGIDNENIDEVGLSAQVVNLAAPDLNTDIEGLFPGDDIMPRLPEHAGPWMIFARDSEGLVRPPRPLVKQVGMVPVVAPRFSEVFFSGGNFSRRSDRIAAFGKVLRGLLDPVASGDLGLYEQQLENLSHGEALSSLDSVVALSQAPALAALLLLRASPDSFLTRLELESVSPFSWTTLPLKAWTTAIKAQSTALFSKLLASGLTEVEAKKYATQAIAHRLRQICDRRPELGGQIIFSAIECYVSEALFKVLPPPSSLSRPEAVLIRVAQDAIKKHDAQRQLFELRSKFAPGAFQSFYDPMRGLLDAPLIAAEYVLGIRSSPPNAEMATALLHYRLHDPDYFETAMPPALAYIHKKIQ
ncbi:hypothetical protein HKX23_18045 [Sulfitobacter sp. KE29]|uniref:STY4851/ECs_5259 family protein n=1 Tax=unclassified Sulfitobacter TaxID=196795 RepID=UPI0023E2DFFA|nr:MULTISPECIES: STY4851/ECs_5259 family protein [unclassified Sulfitobacter]MDF3420253.1 hypothetical protein [Sulfitobacter sp. Ks38]MDF3427738.1 hypothetical protein [Sulfitobacter sp. KE29]MDF3431317.1 hypothetical protein [Sulfitobacter sp. S46]MDF3446091.1 hypothetical protein [Sulfitobacter sp. KE31]MDF3550099.1 hypothetical protein [Sulfitobacter sp. KE28]